MTAFASAPLTTSRRTPLRGGVAASAEVDCSEAPSSCLRWTATATDGRRGADEGWALGEGPGATACRASGDLGGRRKASLTVARVSHDSICIGSTGDFSSMLSEWRGRLS